MNRRIIVLGSDHYNAIGVVQSLGKENLHVIVVINNKGNDSLIAQSNYVKELYQVQDFNEGIDLIANQLVDESPTVIIPCGDEAALFLEKNRERLKEHFVFQYVCKNHSLYQLMDKNIQTIFAINNNIPVPVSYDVCSIPSLPKEVPFPCIIKPLLSCEGDKRDICIAFSEEELHNKVADMLQHTPRVIVQQFIQDKSKELNILGCSFTNGDCILPLCIEKLRVHPIGTGSVSVGMVRPFNEDELKLKDKIVSMVQEMGYVGLFSFEFIREERTGKSYFIEMNLRNDALNTFLVKAGINLPYLHYQDLMGEPLKEYIPTQKSLKMICEPIHMASLHHKSINAIEWLKDIITADSFMLYDNNDKKIFISQFLRPLKRILKRYVVKR